MEETTAEQEKQSLTKRLKKRVHGIVKEIVTNLNTDIQQVSEEEINTQTVASIVEKSIGNPVQERRGNRWKNPFSIVDVLANMGYVDIWSNADYYRKFQKPYKKTRAALHKLVASGVLKLVPLEEPDKNGETFYYQVSDPRTLKRFSS